MSPAWIRRRPIPPSKKNPKPRTSWQVLYRRGGRAFPIEAAGSFQTEREARTRRDLVAGWLAQGLHPKHELAKLKTTMPAARTYEQWAETYATSRLDISEETRKNIGSHLTRLLPFFAGTDPHALTVADQLEAVAKLAAELKPSSVKRYWATHKLILDFAGVDPNPARDPAVKLPQIIREEANPPTADQFVRMLNAMPRRYWLPLVTIEQTAMRVGETQTLAWGDVDVTGNRFRLRSGETKAKRARWVQVPAWLMTVIDATVAAEDRTPGRRVFAGFSADVAKNAMARGCATAGIPHFHPHDLRHRRATIWHHDGVPTRVLMERGGWSRSDIAIDTYSHLMPLDEVPVDMLEALLVMTP